MKEKSQREVLTQISLLPDLSVRRKVHLKNFMFKRKNDSNHVDERMHITRVGDAVLMKTKRARYASYERSVEYRGSREWSNLDVTVRNCTSATEFKSIQKHWLLNSIN